MKVKALSLPCPDSYLLCLNMRNVINLPWTTPYRGTVYIHAGKNEKGLYKLPDPLEKGNYPEEVIAQCNIILSLVDSVPDGREKILRNSMELLKYLVRRKFLKGLGYGFRFLSGWNEIADKCERFYGCDIYAGAPEGQKAAFDEKVAALVKEKGSCIETNAIIGHSSLRDITRNYDSPWADKDSYNWVFEDSEFYEETFQNVPGGEKLFDITNITFSD